MGVLQPYEKMKPPSVHSMQKQARNIIFLFLLGVLGILGILGTLGYLGIFEGHPILVNVAMKGRAVQSSIYTYSKNGEAKNAIDGSRESDYLGESCTHTMGETNPWWRVDLLDVYNIATVTITNRGDCCHERINGAEIRVGNNLDGTSNPLCALISEMREGQTMDFPCKEMEGRYVTVILPGKNKYLTLCEVEVYSSTNRDDPNQPSTPQRKLKRSREDRVKPSTVVPLYRNLAFSGSANQSSQYNYIGAASNAIDGKRTSTYFYNSCTHTKVETNPWWRVDLLDMYKITTVTITNRGDCCAERLNGAEIRIGNDLDGTDNPLCAVISYMKLGQTRDFPCAEMKGRYVTVILPGNDKYLTLCEVEVYSSNQMEDPNRPSTPPPTRPSKPTVQYKNLASSGSASQSSQFNSLGAASNAIDGKREWLYYYSSCTHTNGETNPWWRVDLLDVYNITTVTITNRGDCCHERINGAEIRVGNDLDGTNNPLCAVISEMTEGQTMDFPCKEMEGRYVTVILPGNDKYLTLCEVEVYSSNQMEDPNPPSKLPPPPPTRPFKPTVQYRNLAFSGSANQSSQYNYIGAASNAIDGKRTSTYFYNSCTHTKGETNPWWRVDLLDMYMITTVTITNRGDCCAERINGAEIRVGNDLDGTNNPLCAVISYMKLGQTRDFPCAEMKGRYVTVILPGNDKYLTLCEVEVYSSNQMEDPNPPSTPPPTRPSKPTVQYKNLASSGSASQSSQFNSLGAASNAIDGKREWLYYYSSCTHTNGETNPWWRVDLLDVYNITTVTITNRGDCCHERINGAEIRVGNDLDGTNNPLCAVISEMTEGQTIDFPCKEMEGRYVTVILPGEKKYLTLCEVEVYSSTVKEDINPPSTTPPVPTENVLL